MTDTCFDSRALIMSSHGHRSRPQDEHRRRDDRDDRDRHRDRDRDRERPREREPPSRRGDGHSMRSDDRRPPPSSRDGPREPPPRDPPPPPAAEPLPGPPGMPPPPVKKAEPEIDRTKVCPLLLRVFPKLGGHHRLEEFARVRNTELENEVQIYTWPDATLRELSDLVKEVQPAARSPTSRMGFALVYPDRRGHNVMRVVGQVHSSRVGEDDVKTLRSLKFQTGDYLDVAVF